MTTLGRQRKIQQVSSKRASHFGGLVKKAFLQVGLQSSERDVTRLLWLKDLSKLELNGNIQIYCFARVPFGVISSPFLLGMTVAHHLEKKVNPAAEKIQ